MANKHSKRCLICLWYVYNMFTHNMFIICYNMLIICLCLIWLMMLHIISHHGNVNLILRYHYILVRVGKIRITDNTKFWWGCELSYIAGGSAKWYSHFRRQFGVFLQNLIYSYHTIQQSCSLVFTQMSWKLMASQKTAQRCL